MGRQVNFYLSADDQANMNKIIFTTFPDLIVLKTEMDQRELEFLNTTELIGADNKDVTVLLARQQNLDKIIIDPSFRIIVSPFTVRNMVNTDISPVIDYHRCIQRSAEPNGPMIQRGRLYYHAEYYTENYTQRVPKDPEFINFAQKLFGLFKKKLTYKKEVGNYFGEGALRDEKNGWNLTM